MAGVVQTVNATGVSTTTITTPAFASATTVGNKLIGIAGFAPPANTGVTYTFSDSKSNTWNLDESESNHTAANSTGSYIGSSTIASGKAGTSHTVTFTESSTGAGLQLTAIEANGYGALIGSAGNLAGVSTTSVTATTGSVAGGGLLVAGFAGDTNTTATGVGTTATTLNGSSAGITVVETVSATTILSFQSIYETGIASGTQAVKWTYSSDASGEYTGAVAVYALTPTGGQDLQRGYPITLKPPGMKPWIARQAQLFDPTQASTTLTQISGAMLSASVAAGGIAGAGALAGVAVSASVAEGQLTGAAALSGAAVSASVATGSLGAIAPISGAMLSASVAAGAAAGIGALQGVAVSASVMEGAAAGSGALSGPALSASVTEGQLTGAGALSGAAISASIGPGSLVASSSGAMSGAMVSSSLAAGSLTGAGALSGVAESASIAAGSLAGAGALSGVALSASVTVGDAPLPSTLALSGVFLSSSLAVLDPASLSPVRIPGGFPSNFELAYYEMCEYLRRLLEEELGRTKPRKKVIKSIEARMRRLDAIAKKRDEDDGEALALLL